MFAPVTDDASSEARNIASPAISSGLCDPSHRRLPVDVLVELLFAEHGLGHRRIDEARADPVDPDVLLGVVDRAAEAATTAVQFGASIPRAIRTDVDDHDIDVVGTHGRTGFGRYVLGTAPNSSSARARY